MAQIAVEGHAGRAVSGPVEARRRQRPQPRPLLREPLRDDHAAGRVPAPVADPIAPVGVLLVQLGKRAEAPGRPEAALEVANRRFHRALLARRGRRARRRVEAVVAAQMQKARTPDDLVAFAAGDRRAEVVVDALARHPTKPLERMHVPLQKRLGSHLKREEDSLRARVRQARDQRVHAPLTTCDRRPRRHLAPVELQHLTGPVAGPLRRPHRPRPQLLQMRPHQTLRAGVAIVGAQDLRQARRLDLRPLLQKPPQHRLQWIKLRARRRAPVARWLVGRDHPRDRPPVDPQPRRDLPLRQTICRQRPHPRPLQRASHLRTPRSTSPTERASKPARTRSTTSRVVHFSITDPGAVLGCRRHTNHVSGEPLDLTSRRRMA